MEEPETDPSHAIQDGGLILKGLIWIYYLLLIFEGAFRKWWLPGMSNIFLVIRDPVMILIILEAARTGFLKPHWLLLLTLVLTVVSLFLGLMAEHANVIVTLFGIRANFLHIPLIFIMGNCLTFRDVKWFGIVTVALMVPMAWVMYQQFSGGESSIWNVGAGGKVGGQLSSAMGKVRASGTFSFITGPAVFIPFATAFTLSAFTDRQSVPRWLALPAAFAIPLACASSGSRSAVASVGVIFLALVWAAYLGGNAGRRLIQVSLVAGLAFLIASQTSAFQEANEVLQARFEMAGRREGGLLGFFERFAEGFIKPIRVIFAVPLMGTGIGSGTNAAGALLAGKMNYSWQEDEWSRCMMELGPLFGMVYIGLRVLLTVHVFQATAKAARSGNALPALLLGSGGITLLIGQWGVPTSAGFGVFIPGLILGAVHRQISRPPSTPPDPKRQAVAKPRNLHRAGRFAIHPVPSSR